VEGVFFSLTVNDATVDDDHTKAAGANQGAVEGHIGWSSLEEAEPMVGTKGPAGVTVERRADLLVIAEMEAGAVKRLAGEFDDGVEGRCVDGDIEFFGAGKIESGLTEGFGRNFFWRIPRHFYLGPFGSGLADSVSEVGVIQINP
jgi:hypothetical protein